MKRLFIEAEGFRKRIDGLKEPSLLQIVQNEILRDPNQGRVIPGLGGLRKIRVHDPWRGKGKRGGFRVIYLDFPKREKTYLIWIYGKNEAEDISPREKKIIQQLVDFLKKEDKQNED